MLYNCYAHYLDLLVLCMQILFAMQCLICMASLLCRAFLFLRKNNIMQSDHIIWCFICKLSLLFLVLCMQSVRVPSQQHIPMHASPAGHLIGQAARAAGPLPWHPPTHDCGLTPVLRSTYGFPLYLLCEFILYVRAHGWRYSMLCLRRPGSRSANREHMRPSSRGGRHGHHK